jgi:phosphoribosylformimino-5-aminoimidazole carboxamide ribotide isomerase
VRDAATARTLLEAGAARVILGTVAYSSPALVEALCREAPGRIAVGIDARGEEAAGRGWNEPSGMHPVTLAEQVACAGVACIIYTDITRDGTQTGPNIEATRAMARVLARRSVPLIASGGVGSLTDVRRVAALGPEGVTGLIIGRALYTGSVSLPEALAIASGEEPRPHNS